MVTYQLVRVSVIDEQYVDNINGLIHHLKVFVPFSTALREIERDNCLVLELTIDI